MDLTVNHYESNMYFDKTPNLGSKVNLIHQSFKANTVDQNAAKTATKAIIPAAMVLLLGISDKIKTKIQKERDIHEFKTIKDSDGMRRFYSGDIKDLRKAYAINPEATKQLVALKDEEGIYRFSAEAVYELAEVFPQYPDSVLKLAELKDKNGERRFYGAKGAREIKSLAKAYSENPAAVEKLVLIPYVMMDGEELRYQYRFGMGCENLLKTYEQFPEVVEELATMRDGYNRYLDEEDIVNLAETHSKYPDSVKKLLALKLELGKQRYYYLTPSSVNFLAEVYSKYPDAVEELFTIKDEKNRLRFSIDDIKTLAEVYSQSPDLVKKLAAMKNKDKKYRFSPEDIKNLANAHAKNPEEVDKLIATQVED